jgi:hypothetical protein
MAQATADTLMAPAGATRGRFGRGTPSALPITLGFDGSNPDHICLRCPITGTVPEGTLVRVQHKTAGASTWRDGMFLHRVRLSELVGMPAAVAAVAVNAFVGMVFAPAAASTTAQTFDVRLAVYPPGNAPVQYVTGTHSLRPLVAAAPAVTHNCTPANFATVLASLPHQSGAAVHLRMAAGTYNWTAQAWAKGGTSAFPLYVSAANLGDVIINTPTGDCLLPQASYVVMEKLRFEGSHIDSGTASTSQWLAIPGGAAPVRDWTIRDCEVVGFDIGAKSYEAVQNIYLLRVHIDGNNPWAAAFAPNGWGGTYNNATWNDHGICLPGVGNSAAYCTINGFGDSWRTYAAASWKQWTAGCGMSWCDIRNSGDDMAEFDGGCGNNYMFECRGVNVGNGVSADDTYGPAFVIKPLIVNPSRGPWKLTSDSFGVTVVNATVVMTTKGPDDHGMLVPFGGTQRDFVFVNCATHYAGAGNALHWSSQLARDRWSNNAWWPDRGFLLNTAGNFANLAAAKAGNPARFANDVLLGATPFASPITLGANASIEYLGDPTGPLAVGNAARNAGVPYAGVTDGFTGAAPDIGCVISGQPLAQYGVPALPTEPSWVPPYSATHATYTQLTVANGRLANNVSSQCAPTHDPYRLPTTWTAYAGGVFNPHFGTHGAYFYFGQGHSNGNDNSLHSLIIGEVCRFKRVNEPSAPFGSGSDATTRANNSHADFTPGDTFNGQVIMDAATASYNIDGQPGAPHSYGLPGILPPSPGAPQGTFFLPAVVACNFDHFINTASFTSYKLDLPSESTPPTGVKIQKVFTHPTAPVGSAINTQNFASAPIHTVYDPPSNRRFLIDRTFNPPRWYDHNATTAAAAFVQGTGAPLSVLDGNTIAAHMAVYVPWRRLAVYLYKNGGSGGTGALRLRYMDLSVAQPGWSAPSPPLGLQVQVDDDWCCAAPVGPLQQIVVGDLKGNRALLLHITVPEVLTDTWPCELVPIVGGEPVNWKTAAQRTSDNGQVYNKWAFNEHSHCFEFFNNPSNSGVPDVIDVIRPRGV